jgi:thiamine-phosphate diphosphorylase
MSGGLPLPCVMLVTDRAVCGGTEPLVHAVEEAVAGGVNAVQLREKEMPAAELLALAQRLRRITAGKALLLINDRVDVALACNADGVHLTEASLSVTVVRELLAGRDMLVGRSVHSVDGLDAVGLDYIVAGPMYTTATHPGMEPAGAGLIEGVASAAGVPVVAIGGITAERVPEAMAAGARGVAVIREVLESPEPRQATQQLRKAVDRAAESTPAPAN